MAFLDGLLTAILVISAFYYLIKHFISSGSGCSGCATCRKNGNCCDVPGDKLL